MNKKYLFMFDKCLYNIWADETYLECVSDILEHPLFLSMHQYIQHGTTTCLTHCVNVSYASYKHCYKSGMDYRSAARAGLLHDFFLYDWHGYPHEGLKELHGFAHPRRALNNAMKAFELNEVEQDAILHHMFPLTLTPPKYAEGWIVNRSDKYAGFCETAQGFKVRAARKYGQVMAATVGKIL